MQLYAENKAETIPCGRTKPSVARILLADSDLASRLTLKSLLCEAGYSVDSAASTGEAVGKLDCSEYQLVLADLRTESELAGESLLSYARQKEFHPATALVSSDLTETNGDFAHADAAESLIHMSDADVSYLLMRVAELIGNRADRRLRRNLRRAS
jgi:CheY-like chemotaxis protein